MVPENYSKQPRLKGSSARAGSDLRDGLILLNKEDGGLLLFSIAALSGLLCVDVFNCR